MSKATLKDLNLTLFEQLERLNDDEEIADVLVMLKQFQYYFDIEDKIIKQIMNKKIARQLERIENE